MSRRGVLPCLLALAVLCGAVPALPAQAAPAPSPSTTLEAAWGHDLTRRYVHFPILLTLAALTFLGDAAWLTLALARTRRARAKTLARQAHSPAAKPLRLQGKRIATARAAAGRGKDAALHLPRELEVPKIEHNGEWHTLH